MPVPLRVLTLQGARDHIASRCGAGGGSTAVGLETEWLVVGPNRGLPVPFDVVQLAASADGPLPGGSRITYEPGGQLELSGPPASSSAAAIVAMAADVAAMGDRLAAGGLRLEGRGVDPERPPVRVVDLPRYRAMDAFFGADGAAGHTMMCSTASVQVNVGLAGAAETAAAFDVAHTIGPALLAAFANSPMANGRPTGWQSSRMKTWWEMDRSRCRPSSGGLAGWPDAALDARVMLVRRTLDDYEPVLRPFPFSAWIEHGHPAGFPTLDDLDYHLTTLFPPVRPRGWLEVRYLDALPDPWWQAAGIVVSTLLIDADAGAAAAKAAAGTESLWPDAARCGLRHPGLAVAARGCFEAALAAAADPDGIAAAYFDRYVARGRTPADDMLAMAWH